MGVTSIAVGTLRVRLSVTGSSGATAIDAAQATLVLVSRVSEPPTPTSAQPSRPNSSDPRSQAATGDPRGGGGTATLCRRSTARAKPDASYWVTASSVIPNCTPVEPSSVPTAVIRTHGVSPYGSATVSGTPGRSKLTVDVPLIVDTCNRRTWAPTAVALGVIVRVALVTGRSKSICNHCPSAGCSELDTHAVAGSASTAATGALAGATAGRAVASEEELEALNLPPDHAPTTSGAPGIG